MRFATALLLVTAAVALCGVPAGAVPDAGEPPRTLALEGGGDALTVTADEMSFSNQTGVVSFTGNVSVVRSDMRMRADTLTVTLDRDGEGEGAARRIRMMVADGEVTFTYGERTATAGHAAYDPVAGTVVLTDQPRVADPAMTVVGKRITIDLATQESTVEGGAFTFTEGP